MRTAMTSARAMFECVGCIKMPSGFDFERGLVVTGKVWSEITGGVCWNEGDICNSETEYGCEFVVTLAGKTDKEMEFCDGG